MSARSARSIAIRKKKARRVIGRAKPSRNQGNTAGVRRALKKASAKSRKAKSAE